MPLFVLFLAATAGALAYQRWKGRPWGRALHLAIVFGFATMLIVFLVAVLLEAFGVLPPVRFGV